MAYGGKSDSPSAPSTSTVNLKYISARNTDDSTYAVVDIDAFKHSRVKGNRYNKGLNSGTPCIYTAFTPLGKPSALSTSKNIANHKHLTSGTSVNDSSNPAVFKSRPNKLFNPSISCTSKPLTLMEKPSTMSAVNPTELLPKNAVKNSKSPPIKYSKSNPANQSSTRSDAALETSTTMCSVRAKELIPIETINDSKSPTIKYNKSNTTHQNIMKYYNALENSSVTHHVEAKDHERNHRKKPSTMSAVNPTELLPKNAVKESKSPPIKYSKSNPANQSITRSDAALQTSTTMCNVRAKELIPTKTINDSKSPTVKYNKSNTTHQNIMKYYNALENSSVTHPVEAKDHERNHRKKPSTMSAVNPTELLPRNAVKDSKSLPIKYSKSNPANQSITRSDAALETSTTMCSVRAKELIPTKTINDSKSPTLKYNKYNTTHQNIMKYYNALENSSVTHPVEAKDFIPTKTVNDFKSPPFISNEAVNDSKPKSRTTHPDMMEYYSFLRRSSAVSSRSFTPRKSSNDSKSSTSETVHQSTFNKYYTNSSRNSYPSENTPGSLTDFNFGGRKSEDSCSSQVSSRTGENRPLSSVDLLRCIICIDKERDTVFQPCGHLIVCSKCANSIQSTCPTCRKRIKKKIKAYIN